MQKLTILAIAFLLVSPTLFAQSKAGKKDTTQHTSIYACPKHADVAYNEPGKCPKCGMELTLTTKEQMKAGAMKNYACPLHLEVTSHDPGKCPKCGKKLNLSVKEQMKAEVTKIYTCPMHPEVALDKEGKCPKCGGSLVEKKQSK